MLIKEYRIPLPLSVEEYKIAQLYMIQKKSRLDSTGEGSGVEIIENQPYKDGPGGSGQYTKKIYHIGNHIPGWLKAIVPKSALQVIEEAWNAYPYTKMKTTCPFVEKFYVDVETKYLPDNGGTKNVFNLSPAELGNQTTDLIDPVKDPVPTSQYSKEEDPLLYVSKKTGRGPLTADWLQQPQKSIMCAYKRITVEFKYWGMQGKIEQFIHDGLRKPMLMGHRQAWVWQDEWYGLTINDIRELEKETQRMLAKKMGNVSDLNLSRRISGGQEGADENSRNDALRPVEDIKTCGSAIELLSQESVETEGFSTTNATDREERSPVSWRIGSFNSSDSEQEFFDAQDVFDSEGSEDEYSETFVKDGSTFGQSSHSGGSVESLDSYTNQKEKELQSVKKAVGKTVSFGSSVATNSSSSCQFNVLILIVHGGNPLEALSDLTSKKNDCERLIREFQNVMQNHYKEGLGRIAFRLVECPQVFKDALRGLKDITPQSTDDCCTEGQGFCLSSFNFPVSSLPILAACSSGFGEVVDRTVTEANNVYREFITSEAGAGFNGEVCIVGDCIGGLLAYEALCLQSCKMWSTGSFDTDISVSSRGLPPSSPSKKDKRPFRQTSRRVSDQRPLEDSAFQNCRLSSSEVNIRSTVSEKDDRSFYDEGFDNLEDFKRTLSVERTESILSGDGRDRMLSDSSSIPNEPVNKFDFDTSKFFAFGSPIGLVSLYKRFSSNKDSPVKPACGQFYNLFHPFDPLSSRIEPLIMPEFSQLPPVNVPRYQKFPLGDGLGNDVTSWISKRKDIFSEKKKDEEKKKAERQESGASSSSCLSWEMFRGPVSKELREGLQNWWGTERLDYALYNPKSLHQLPLSVLCPLFHISYWESKDVVAFMIRQILDFSGSVVEYSICERRERRLSSFHIPNPREKWLKKTTAYKIRNLASNHRANDAIAMEDSAQIITARFTYGPLDVATLTGEKVDVYIMSYPPAGEWNLIDTGITGSGGRLSFTVPDERKLGVGIYPVKMVVRGDHTTVDCSLAVLPPKTETVVFSIDGSFSASVSIRGRHPKVQPGAVDVVRHWQELGYLIMYVTSRPDFQKHQVMPWMAEHNFPFGLVSFCGSLSTVDIRRNKTEFLRNLTNNTKVVIHAAYGSTKDVAVYSGVGLEPNEIFVIAKHSTKRNEKQATFLRDGYASHLTSLANNPISRPPTGNSRLTLRRGCFCLPSKHRQSSKRSGTSSKGLLN